MSYATDNRWNVFLSKIAKIPDRSTALREAQITPEEYLERCKHDSKFVMSVAEYFDAGIDALEDTAIRRAVLGVEEPVFWQGQVVGWKTVYSDRLLTFLLAGNRAKYRGEGEKAGALSPEARETLSNVFKSISEDEPSAEKPNFSSTEEAVSETAPRGRQRPGRKEKNVIFEPPPEVEVSVKPVSIATLLDEVKTEATEEDFVTDFGLPPSDEELALLDPVPASRGAKLPATIRKERTPPPPKPEKRGRGGAKK